MPKRGRDETPSVNNVSNRDIVQRLNFLYQAGAYLNGLGSSISTPIEKPSQEGDGILGLKRRKRCAPTSIHDLGAVCIDTMKMVGQKATAKMDPAVKRSICKGCNAILMPGATMSIRVKKKSRTHGRRISYLCGTCRTSRSIPTPAQPRLEGEVTPGVREEGPSTETPVDHVHPPLPSPQGAKYTIFCGNERLPMADPQLGNGSYNS